MDVVNFAALEVPTITFGQTGGHGHHTRMDDLGGWSPAGLEDALLMAVTLGRRLADQPTLGFSHDFPPALLQEIRDYAARWGWGVRPEANLPPKF
jgi:hypothetical protein